MRNIIRFVLLAATAAAPLAAQGWQGDRAQTGQETRQNRPDVRGDRQNARPDAAPVRNEAARGDFRDGRPDRAGVQRDRGQPGGDRRDGYRDGRQDGRDRADGRPGDRRNWQDNRGRDDRGNGYAYGRGDNRDNRGGWDNRWRNDRRYNWQGYRSSNRNLYRMPRYAGPRGYDRGYSRWSAGSRIQPYFYGQSYWINDPYRYRLPPAYGGYRWVRYYDDVALVDIRSGLIADVIYSFFY